MTATNRTSIYDHYTALGINNCHAPTDAIASQRHSVEPTSRRVAWRGVCGVWCVLKVNFSRRTVPISF